MLVKISVGHFEALRIGLLISKRAHILALNMFKLVKDKNSHMLTLIVDKPDQIEPVAFKLAIEYFENYNANMPLATDPDTEKRGT